MGYQHDHERGMMDDKFNYILEKYDKALEHIIDSSNQNAKHQNRISLALVACIIIISLLAYFNNRHWIEVFNSYEYVTTTETVTYEQDGADVNSVNLGEMGDLINGSEINGYNDNKDDEEESTD